MLSSNEPSADGANSEVRLYVAPLTPELVQKITPSTYKSDVKDISYHKLQNRPETNYGFISLPRMEAEKLKKKLNHSILKGQKMRIEEARPRKRLRTEDTEHSENSGDQGSGAKSTSPIGTELKGRQLSPDRKVKRGWTEPQKNRQKRKATEESTRPTASKYSEHEECLFRAKVPPNRAENGVRSTKKPHQDQSVKKGQETVVHEFKKSSAHPSFLRNGAPKPRSHLTASFVDGKGWVNEAGDVVESAPISPAGTPNGRDVSDNDQSKSGSEDSDVTYSDSSSITNNESLHAEAEAPTPHDEAQLSTSAIVRPGGVPKDEETSSSGSSVVSDTPDDTTTSTPSQSQLNIKGLEPAKLHPLEAIFKQPKRGDSKSANKPNLGISTSFNFFDNEAGSETEIMMPATPFTRDLQTRTLRSAAPTPDTAAPTKTAFFQPGQAPRSHPATVMQNDGQELLEPLHEAGHTATGTPQGKKEPSNFSQWFWANRGDNNRAWRKLRRDAAKEKRQTENKERGQRFGRA